MERHRSFGKSVHTDLLLFVLGIFAGGLIACARADTVNPHTAPDKPGQEAVIQDRKGMTLKGRVTCQGRGLARVAVSDGIEVTTTDDSGVYYLSLIHI